MKQDNVTEPGPCLIRLTIRVKKRSNTHCLKNNINHDEFLMVIPITVLSHYYSVRTDFQRTSHHTHRK